VTATETVRPGDLCGPEDEGAEVAVHVAFGSVAWFAPVDDEDRPASSAEKEFCGHAGGATTDDQHVDGWI